MSEPNRADDRTAELALPPELRQALGLADDEPVRLIETAERTILLERTEAAANAPLPHHGALVLVANVGIFPLADVLGLLHATGRSGFLFFSHQEHAKSVYLRSGEVVFATSNQRADRIGSCLVRAGAISLEQLREAERHFSPPDRFGKVLVELGFLTPRQLWNGVKFQVEEIVRSLFSHVAGTVYFWEGEVQPDNVVRLSLPMRRLVAEGLERRDELLHFIAVLQDDQARIEAVAGRKGNLAGSERRFFEALELESHFPAVCERVGLDPLAGARAVQLLRLVGAVRIRRGTQDEERAQAARLRRDADDALQQCVLEHVKLLAELAAPLVAVDGPGPVRTRLEREIRELVERFPELLEGVCPGPSGTLDPEHLGRRALGLAEPREDQVRSALGELVSYLEFELKNHPRIEEADHFLAAVEPLRARLSA